MDIQARKTLRLIGYDYSNEGLYFITICTNEKRNLFGKIIASDDVSGMLPTDTVNNNRPPDAEAAPVGAIINRPPDTDDAPIVATINRPYMQLSEYGIIVDKAINNIPTHYCNVNVDRYVVMPNHVHMILELRTNDTDGRVENGGRLIIAPTGNVSIIVKQLKQYVTKQLGCTVWQKSFYDHIIRDEQDYIHIAEYIDNNLTRWAEDKYYAPNL